MYKIIDYYCQNTTCNKLLSDYEVDRQKNKSRSFRYRFCRHCRQLSQGSPNCVIWKCRECETTLTPVHNVRGCYYCKACGPKLALRNSRARARKKVLLGKPKTRKIYADPKRLNWIMSKEKTLPKKD